MLDIPPDRRAEGGDTVDDLISRESLLYECAECQKTDPYFEERGWASHFINSAGEPSAEWYCVEDMIENAPTIDAIPVEWLKQKRDGQSAPWDYLANAIDYILAVYKKEQEAG
jgi:hypothetical protein